MRELFTLLETWRRRAARFSSPARPAPQGARRARDHHNSPRRAQRFVAIHCGAIPKRCSRRSCSARARRVHRRRRHAAGRFEEANRGTIFLDEVSTMPPTLQMKLLRVIQNARCSASAIRRREGGRAHHRGTNHDLAGWSPRHVPRGSLLPPHVIRCTCRRCATGRTTCRCSCSTS